MSARACNEAGLAIIRIYEGLHRLGRDGMIHPYFDPIGLPTIGYGHLLSKTPRADLSQWPAITREAAEHLLLEDLSPREDAVLRLVRVPLTDNQFSALVSWVFNLGSGALRASSALRELNRGDYDAAADQLLRWNMAGGRVLPGLVRRRAAERALFLA